MLIDKGLRAAVELRPGEKCARQLHDLIGMAQRLALALDAIDFIPIDPPQQCPARACKAAQAGRADRRRCTKKKMPSQRWQTTTE